MVTLVDTGSDWELGDRCEAVHWALGRYRTFQRAEIGLRDCTAAVAAAAAVPTPWHWNCHCCW